MGVTFTSIYAPGSEFAIAENSTSGAVTNQVTGIAGPASLTPEPASITMMLAAGTALLAFGFARSRNREV